MDTSPQRLDAGSNRHGPSRAPLRQACLCCLLLMSKEAIPPCKMFTAKFPVQISDAQSQLLTHSRQQHFFSTYAVAIPIPAQPLGVKVPVSGKQKQPPRRSPGGTEAGATQTLPPWTVLQPGIAVQRHEVRAPMARHRGLGQVPGQAAAAADPWVNARLMLPQSGASTCAQPRWGWPREC